MKRILAVSDTHGNIGALRCLEKEMEKADYIFHLGDHYYDMVPFEEKFGKKIYSVKGNCDGGGEEYLFINDGVKILLVHGDAYHVKSSLLRLSLRAEELGVNAVFFGHTHRAAIEESGGALLINPGALSRFSEKTYCVAKISDDGLIAAEIKNLGDRRESE